MFLNLLSAAKGILICSSGCKELTLVLIDQHVYDIAYTN